VDNHNQHLVPRKNHRLQVIATATRTKGGGDTAKAVPTSLRPTVLHPRRRPRRRPAHSGPRRHSHRRHACGGHCPSPRRVRNPSTSVKPMAAQHPAPPQPTRSSTTGPDAGRGGPGPIPPVTPFLDLRAHPGLCSSPGNRDRQLGSLHGKATSHTNLTVDGDGRIWTASP
jgi:hypothetical protein